MNQGFMRREWGAVAFLVATALGIIVVPIGLNLNKRNVPAATESLITASPSPTASGSPEASPAASPSAVASPAPSATSSPKPTAAPSGASTPAPSPS